MAVATIYSTRDVRSQKDGFSAVPDSGSLVDGGSSTLTFGYTSSCSGTNSHHACFYGDFSSIVGHTVSACTFYLYVDTIGANVQQVGRLTSTWAESGTAPNGYAGTRVDWYTTTTGAFFGVSLLEYAQYWAAGNTNYGIGIGPTTATVEHFVVRAREDANDPYFSVTYNTLPTQPGAFTSPAAGQDFNASLTATHGASTDANGDAINYSLKYLIAPYTVEQDLGFGGNGVLSRSVDCSGWTAGSYKLRVYPSDGTGFGPSRDSDIFTVTHNVAPGVPTAVGRDPSNDSTDTTPLLTATITDANSGQQIKARFQIYQNDGTTLVGTVDSAFRTGNGVVTAEYSSALAVGQYKVQAKTIDDTALESAYSSQVPFQVTSLVTKDLSLLWNTKLLVTDDLTIYWNVARNGEKDLTLLWNTLLEVHKDLEILWNAHPYWENVPYEETSPTWGEVAP